ncbi:hypothetical protein D9M68_804750 [compost metagenome]
MESPARAQMRAAPVIEQLQAPAAFQLTDDLRHEQSPIARMWVPGSQPVTSPREVTRGREQQARCITFADGLADVGWQYGMQMR